MRFYWLRTIVVALALGGTIACGPERGFKPPATQAVLSRGAAPRGIDPVDSGLALFARGGGCYPPAISASGLELLTLVDPEWASVVDGHIIFSTPVLVHATAVTSGISKEDFPATHVRFDQNTDLALEPAELGRLATGNYFPPSLVHGEPVLELEWETASYPAWAWAGEGDRVVALGRWIFDCGHPDPIPGLCQGTTHNCLTDADCATGVQCEGTVFNYRSEIHPPEATAVIRTGRGAILEGGEDDQGEPVPATRVDVFVSPGGGGAGDACVVTHRGLLGLVFGPSCFPLAAPLALLPPDAPVLNARDFAFDVPLPRVARGREPVLQVLPRPTPSLVGPPVPAQLQVIPRLDGPDPHFEVNVRMTEPVDGRLPTGFAATLLAGWQQAPRSPLVRVRVTLEGVVIRAALKPVFPGVPTPPGWKLQANVNGEWQEIDGLEEVASGSEGRLFPVNAVYEQFLPRDGTLRLRADAASLGCVDTMFGQSLLEDLIRFGYNPADPDTLPGALELGQTCLNATEGDPGAVEMSFFGPRFGARRAPYEIASRGGGARSCSRTASLVCATDDDCPAEETCDGAFKLRFRIERVDEDQNR